MVGIHLENLLQFLDGLLALAGLDERGGGRQMLVELLLAGALGARHLVLGLDLPSALLDQAVLGLGLREQGLLHLRQACLGLLQLGGRGARLGGHRVDVEGVGLLDQYLHLLDLRLPFGHGGGGLGQGLGPLLGQLGRRGGPGFGGLVLQAQGRDLRDLLRVAGAQLVGLLAHGGQLGGQLLALRFGCLQGGGGLLGRVPSPPASPRSGNARPRRARARRPAPPPPWPASRRVRRCGRSAPRSRWPWRPGTA